MTRFLLLVCLSGLSLCVSAQSEVFWQQPTAGFNTTVQQAVLAGQDGSTIRIIQSGKNNVLATQTQGNGNNLTYQQLGDGNQLELNLIGSNNSYKVDQLGNQNVLSLPEVRSNNTDIQLIQRGNGNQLIKESGLSQGVPMRIEQNGGMKLIISNSKF